MPTHGECSDKQEHLRPIKKHPNHSKYLQITNCGVALPSLSPSSSLAFRQVGLLPTFSVLFSLRVRIHVYPTLVRSQSHMFLYSMSHCAYVQIYIYNYIYILCLCVCVFISRLRRIPQPHKTASCALASISTVPLQASFVACTCCKFMTLGNEGNQGRRGKTSVKSMVETCKDY